MILPKCLSLGSTVHQNPRRDCPKTTTSIFIVYLEPTVRCPKVLFNLFFGVLSSSHLFRLAGEPEMREPDDW